MSERLGWLLAPLVILEVGMRIFALTRLARARRVRGQKWAWALIIVFVSFAGWIAFLLAGQSEELDD